MSNFRAVLLEVIAELAKPSRLARTAILQEAQRHLGLDRNDTERDISHASR